MIANSINQGISVIIPMYNSERTIVRALESIRKQTAFESVLEVIVVNDGSQDGSAKIVESYAKKYPTFPITLINKTNAGVSSARNVGMSRARGDWFALLDSDDEWTIDKLEIQLEIIRNNVGIDFLGGAIDQKPLKILNRTIIELYRATIKDLCIKMFPQTSTVIFKREIFDLLGGYDENQTHAEDANYFMKVCTRFSYYYMPRQMVIYDGGKRGFGSAGLSGNLRKMHEGTIKNITELKEQSVISPVFYFIMRIFYWAKYMRRIIVVKTSRGV